MSDYVDIVFDKEPGPVPPSFIEADDSTGKSIRVGEWLKRSDGYWVLRIPSNPEVDGLKAQLADYGIQEAQLGTERANCQRLRIEKSELERQLTAETERREKAEATAAEMLNAGRELVEAFYWYLNGVENRNGRADLAMRRLNKMVDMCNSITPGASLLARLRAAEGLKKVAEHTLSQWHALHENLRVVRERITDPKMVRLASECPEQTCVQLRAALSAFEATGKVGEGNDGKGNQAADRQGVEGGKSGNI